MTSTLVDGGTGRCSWRCGGQEQVDLVDRTSVCSFCMPVGSSKDCICTSSSLTTPPTPSLVIDAVDDRAAAARRRDAATAYTTAGPRGRRSTCAASERVIGSGGHRQAAARHRDRVDLLDEADRAALLARGLAQRLEVRADLARGGAVVHRLERGRRDEEERHAGLARHRLGEVGLAGAGLALEEQAAARRCRPSRAAKVLWARNRLSERTTSSFTVSMPDDVVERDVDLLGAVGHVRRAAGADRACRRARGSARGRTAPG